MQDNRRKYNKRKMAGVIHLNSELSVSLVSQEPKWFTFNDQRNIFVQDAIYNGPNTAHITPLAVYWTPLMLTWWALLSFNKRTSNCWARPIELCCRSFGTLIQTPSKVILMSRLVAPAKHEGKGRQKWPASPLLAPISKIIIFSHIPFKIENSTLCLLSHHKKISVRIMVFLSHYWNWVMISLSISIY